MEAKITEERPVISNPFENTNTCKVVVCEPSSGYIDAIAYDNRKDFWVELTDLKHRSNFRFFNWGTHRLHTSYARETCTENALESGMDYILFVDDDMIVPKRIFERLFKTMQETGADIISPLCTQRVYPYKPVIFKITINETDGNRYFHNEIDGSYEPNTVVEADAVGFGVVLIKASILKKIKKPFFFSNASIGEDIWFCWRARQEAGAKVMVDTRIKVGHLGLPPIVTELDYVVHNDLKGKFDSIYGKYMNKLEIRNEKGQEVVSNG